MKQQIKAIETRYAGCRFRSRLEARWAVFFDKAGIEWQYELEGFEDESWNPPLSYLPDFFLPETETWVEVKGSDEMMRRDSARLEDFLDFNCPMPHFTGSADDHRFGVCHGLLILGEVPYISGHGPVFHPIIQHHEGLIWKWACFEDVLVVRLGTRWSVGASAYDDDNYLLSYIIGSEQARGPEEWTTSSVTSNTGWTHNNVKWAYEAARAARFEHGESG